MQKVSNFGELCRVMYDLTKEKDVSEIKTAMADKTTETYFVSRLMRVYMGAQSRAANFGYIGVGAISFAEARLIDFQRRANTIAAR